MTKFRAYMQPYHRNFYVEVESPTDDMETIVQLAKDKAAETPVEWNVIDYERAE